jgi:hypothetical protein
MIRALKPDHVAERRECDPPPFAIVCHCCPTPSRPPLRRRCVRCAKQKRPLWRPRAIAWPACARVQRTRQEIGVKRAVGRVVDVVADEEDQDPGSCDSRRGAERKQRERRGGEGRSYQDERQSPTERRGRKPIGDLPGGEWDDQRERALNADQGPHRGRRVRQAQQDHRPVRRENGDRE